MLTLPQLNALFKIAPKNDICYYLNGIYVELHSDHSAYMVTNKHELVYVYDEELIENLSGKELNHVFLPYATLQAYLKVNKPLKWVNQQEKVKVMIDSSGNIILKGVTGGQDILADNINNGKTQNITYPDVYKLYDTWLAKHLDTKDNPDSFGLFPSKTMAFMEEYEKAFEETEHDIYSCEGSLLYQNRRLGFNSFFLACKRKL